MEASLDTLSDESLAETVQHGNTESFSELVRGYEPKLLRYGRTFLRNPADIEDLVQDTFVKAYENIQSFDVLQRFSPWMYRIAHNTFVNRLRKNSRNPVSYLDLDLVLPQLSVPPHQEDEHEEAEMRTLVSRGIERIPAKYREVLILHYFENLSYKEIANVLRIPVGTVGIRLSRARTALKNVLPNSDTLSL